MHHLGNQYEWIASFAYQFGLDDLEMSAEYNAGPEAGQAVFLYNNVIKVENQRIGSYYILDDASRNTTLSLFSCFHFSVLDISKADMQKEAEQQGFDHILKQTWFCHSPIGTTPCGVCKPCQTVVRAGLEFRLTMGGLIRYHMRNYILWINTKFRDVKLYLKFKRLIRNAFG